MEFMILQYCFIFLVVFAIKNCGITVLKYHIVFALPLKVCMVFALPLNVPLERDNYKLNNMLNIQI